MKTFSTLALFLLVSLVTTATSRPVDVLRLDSVANQQFASEQYVDAVRTRQQLIASLNPGDNDSLHAFSLVQIARCLSREELADSAATVGKQALRVYSRAFGTQSMDYAIIADNVSFYLLQAKRYQEAVSYSEKALAVINSVPDLTGSYVDESIILVHAAENYNAVGRNPLAIACELRALKLMSDIYGEHSDTYIDELQFLSKFFADNGDKEKAGQTDDTITRLRKEKKDAGGDVLDIPATVKMDSPREAERYRWATLRACDYYLSHYITADHMAEAASLIAQWVTVTDEVTVTLDSSLLDLGNNQQQSLAYLPAFLAGCCRYALQSGEKDFSWNMYGTAMADLLNFYNANAPYTGKVDSLEKLIAAYAKNRDQFVDNLKQLYNRAMDGRKQQR